MIVYTHQGDGCYGPVVKCDRCKKQIDDASEGVVLILRQLSCGPDEHPVLHVHHACRQEIEERIGGRAGKFGWHHLSMHARMMLVNLNITPEELIEARERDREFREREEAYAKSTRHP